MGVNGLIIKVLQEVGLNPARFSLQWASAAEAPRFVKLITDFTNTVKNLGPLGHAEGLKPEEAKQRAEKALALVSDRKLRMGFGNLSKELRKEIPGITDKSIAVAVDEKLSKTIAAITG
ncbi:MAG: hydrogenase iron-sulfur subunit [Proteobacteria bacterium]|nr:hydrogenase iron-sulfur subunit [Pseudomonadota bacterium]MBU1739061.1 hydrogenase iron-sulfur subunit [Pseudomonadota bacterium]